MQSVLKLENGDLGAPVSVDLQGVWAVTLSRSALLCVCGFCTGCYFDGPTWWSCPFLVSAFFVLVGYLIPLLGF